MVAATREFRPSSRGDASAIALARIDYAAEAEPVGTMPPPAGLLDGVKTAAKMMRGQQPTLLLDKLGERLAFERTGVRLYEALLSKHDSSLGGGLTRADVQHILDEEREHFALLREVMEARGGDPTAVTPSADVQATASKGLCAVLADPRTTFVEGVEAILIAELTDNECWDALIGLADAAGERELVARFAEARDTEREHLQRVRGWLANAHSRAMTAGVFPASRRPPLSARASGRKSTTRSATGRQKRAPGKKRTTGKKRAQATPRAR
jgi:rubrerythrin